MKVWRVISLTLWGLVLTILLLVSGIHFLLAYTVLDQGKTTNALQQTSFYSALRDELFLPAIEKQLPDASGEAALSQADVQAAINEIFTTDKVRSVSAHVVDATYNWLDKKSPNLEFTVPITNEKQTLLDKLTARVTQNIAALPVCSSYSGTADNLASATCLPPYVSRASATDQVMSEIANRIRDTPDAITADTVGLTPREMRQATNIPDYLGYLWALNLITLPLALIISLYLLLKRRGAGLITISAAIVILGLTAFAGSLSFQNTDLMNPGDVLGAEMLKATKLLVMPTLTLAGIVGIGAGIVGIIGGIFWQRNKTD